MLAPYYNVYERIIWQVKYPNCDWENELIEDWVLVFKDKRPYNEYRNSRIINEYFDDKVIEIRKSSE